MGHEVIHFEFDENEDKGMMIATAEDQAIYASDMRDGLPSSIRFLEENTYIDKEEAYGAIRKLDRDHYDQLAVKFISYEDVKETKTIINLGDRIARMNDSLIDYKSKSSIKNRKSQYVGCTKCGSKINKDYVKDLGYNWNRCPLCMEDLSSETVKASLANKEDKIAELQDDLADKRRLNQRKGKKSVKWLVKIEYHI